MAEKATPYLVTPGSYSFTNLTVDAKGRITSASSGSIGGGTVTSVDMAVPSEFTLTGHPITTFGTITIGKSSQSAHAVWAGPTSGGASRSDISLTGCE